jgi:hypothetical protein
MTRMPGRERLWLTALAIAVVSPALFGGFVLDDQHAVLESVCVTGSFRPDLIFGRNFWCEPAAQQTVDAWRPWVVMVWWPLWHFGGGTAYVFHALGLVLHAACTVQVVELGRELGLGRSAALVGATAFSVAPIHLDAVASVVGNADVWCTLWILLTVRAHLRGQLHALPYGALAVLSKETGVMVVPLLVLVELLGPRPSDATTAGRRRLGVLMLTVLVVGLLVARAYVLGSFFGTHITVAVNPLLVEPWHARLPTALDLLRRYLQLTATGYPLSADYSYAAVPVGTSIEWLGVGLGAGLLMAFIVVLFWHRREPATRLLVLWFLLAFLFVSNLLALLPAIFAERLFYAATVPLFLLVGSLVGPYLSRRGPRVIVVAYVLVGAVLSFAHARAWNNETTLTAVTVEHSPDSARAHVWRARVLAREGQARQVELHARRAIEILPTWGAPHALLGASLDLQGQPERALTAFRRALVLDAADPEVADLFVQFLLRYGHLDQARAVFERHRIARGGQPATSVTTPR